MSDYQILKGQLEEKYSDIEKIKQDEGIDAVVRIAYTDIYVLSMEYFRGIVKIEELSERALKLTTLIIDCNAANYTAWQYRRDCIRKLKYDLLKELEWIDGITLQNPKNYQVWQHRKCIIELLDKPKNELERTKFTLMNVDSKNYHVWSHRQWVLNKFNLWKDEFKFVDELIIKDIRNNSAWNQRYNTCKLTNGFSKDNIGELLDSEFEYTFDKIESCPNNLSPWNYLRGLFKPLINEEKQFNEDEFANRAKQLEKFIDKILTKDPECLYAIAFHVDINKWINSKESIKQAKEQCQVLAEKDAIRKNYWLYVAKNLKQI